jgi:protein TonB
MSFVTIRVNALNRDYKRGMEVSFVIVLLLIIAAFRFSPDKNKTQQIKQSVPDIIVVTEVDPTTQLSQPPSPPNPPVLIETSLDDEIEDIILQSTDIDFDLNVPDVPQPPEPPVINDEIVPFKDLESYPEPVGGMKSISDKIHYTELAKRAGIEGTVTIEAILDKNGDVIEAEIVKGIGGGLDEIALQAINDTKFIPGMQRGKPVKVRLSIPVKFRLQ